MKTYDSELYETNDPFDELALYSVEQAQRDCWDELRPSITLMERCYDSDSNTPNGTSDDPLVSPNWACLRVIPWIVSPGDAQIKVHIRCCGPVSADYAPQIRVCESPVPPSGNTSAANTVTAAVYGSSSFGWKTLTLDLQPSDTARFTFIQVWYKSDEGYAKENQSFYTNTLFPSVPWQSADGRFVEDDGAWWSGFYPVDYEPRKSAFFRVREATAGDVSAGLAASPGDVLIVDSYKVVSYNQRAYKPGTGFINAWEVFPPLAPWDQGDDVATGFAVHDLPALYVRNIMVETVRESSAPPSRFFTAAPDQIRAGELPKSTAMLALTSGEDQLYRLRKPLAGALPCAVPDEYNDRVSWIGESSGFEVGIYVTKRFHYAQFDQNGTITETVVPLSVRTTVNPIPGQTRMTAFIILTSLGRAGVNAARGVGQYIDGNSAVVDVTVDVSEPNTSGTYTDLGIEQVVEGVRVPDFAPAGDNMLKYLAQNLNQAATEMSYSDVASLLDPNYTKLLKIDIPSVTRSVTGEDALYVKPLSVRLSITPNAAQQRYARVAVLAFFLQAEA